MPLDGDGNQNSQVSSARRETEKLLQLAEQLDEKCQKNDKQGFLALAGSLAILIATLISSYLVFYLAEWTLTTRMVILTAVDSYIMLLCFAIMMRALYIQKLGKRDLRALRETVGILRETEKVLNLTALERAELRIKLSRFDIGPPSPQQSYPSSQQPYQAPEFRPLK